MQYAQISDKGPSN